MAPGARRKPGRIRRVAGWVLRATRNLLAIGMLAQLVLIFTPATERVYDWLSVSVASPERADYIVCLGGGSGREGRAAQLWHRKVAPFVIVSNAPGAAEWMRNVVADCGVPRDRIIVDNRSYTTAGHPPAVAELRGIDRESQRFVIVTDHTHGRRSRACFAEAGYKHIAIHSGREPNPRTSFRDVLEWRVYTIPPILYELAAMVQYWCEGKLSLRTLFQPA